MGSYPSVCSITSSDVSRDVEHLKRLFPDKKFSVEKAEESSESITLFAQDGKLTLILVANSNSSSNSNSNATIGDVATLVVDESDIKTIAKNKEKEKPRKIKKGSKSFITEDIRLPGGSVLVLITPAMVSSRRGRQLLTKTLTRHTSNASNNCDNDNADSVAASSCDDRASSEPQDAAETDSRSSSSSVASPQHDGYPELPSFPTLDFRLLQKDGHFEPNFPLNSRVGVPFETELFQGKILFLLRPPGDPAKEDPYWNERIFAHKQRRFIVQVQGTFKKKPKGVLYAGGEITEPMKLGLVTKGLARGMLSLLKSFYQHVHYSFGDNQEMAHIVFPAYQFFERLVVTKPGETPPTLGEPFEESDKSIRERKAGKSLGDWNTEDTYTASFYTMYLDLPTWSVCSLRFANDISLRNFWGKSLLRICLYDRVAPKDEKKHKPEYNTYGFVIKAEYLGSSGSKSRQKKKNEAKNRGNAGHANVSDNNIQAGDDEVSSAEEGNILDWTERGEKRRDNEKPSFMPKSESQVFSVEEDDEEEEDSLDMNQFFDAAEYREEDCEGSTSNIAQNHSQDILNSVDNLCPSWIEMIIHRGNYARAYALNIVSDMSGRTIFRRADSVLDLFESSSENICSPRMSCAEKTRRRLGQLLLENANSVDLLEKLDATNSEYDGSFLNREESSSSNKYSSAVHKSGFVARALSDHHWIEEWAIITERSISFHHPDRKKPNYRVGIQHISRVEKSKPNESPYFPNHSFLSVETLGRTSYLMFRSEDQRDDWYETLAKLTKTLPSSVDATDSSSLGNASNAALELQNPKYEFLHKSSLWDYKHRRVLNCRRFSFRSRERSFQENPLVLVEDALRKALDPRNDSDDDILISFLDSAAKLKDANVYELSQKERLVFFLNLYHCMVMHAYLVLGPPESSFQWISYFNSIAYQCSDDIFSLAELEHCIIRSNMSSPRQFLSRFVIPNSKYDLSLSATDCRLNFALNCGSMSNPACVPVFKVTEIDRQLDDVSRLYLSAAVKVKKRSSREVEVFLPRVCLWYSDDFGSSNEDVLNRVMPWVNSDVQEFISSFMKSDNKGKCSVKYLAYDFDCRRLSLTPE